MNSLHSKNMDYLYSLLVNYSIPISLLTIIVSFYKLSALCPDDKEQDVPYFDYLKKNLNLYVLGLAVMLVCGKYFAYRFEYDFLQDSPNLNVIMLIVTFTLTLCGFVATIVFGLSNIFCTRKSFERKWLVDAEQDQESE